VLFNSTNLSVTNGPVGRFSVVTYFLLNSTTVENVAYQASSLLCGIEVEGWPFLSKSNSLMFGITLSQPGVTPTVTDEANFVLVEGGNQEIEFGKFAEIDSQSQPIGVTVSNSLVEFVFPYFNSTVLYESKVDVQQNNTNSTMSRRGTEVFRMSLGAVQSGSSAVFLSAVVLAASAAVSLVL